MSKTYIIAEIGINHNGDLDIAKKLIDVAKSTGCDSVKFQKRNPDVCVPEHQKQIMRETPWGRMTYLDYKYKVEFGKDEYDEIDRYCREKNIDWSASPWDIDSLIFLLNYDLSYIKIPSAMLTNDKLLKATASTGKKVILSTGMSTIEEIDKAVDILGDCDYTLLQCNSVYPAPNEDLNLRCIHTLRDRYNCEVGYSGHERGLQVSVASVALGASIVERHITLDRTMWGTDQSASLEPAGLNTLVRDIRIIEKALGDGVKKVTEQEKPIKKKLRN